MSALRKLGITSVAWVTACSGEPGLGLVTPRPSTITLVPSGSVSILSGQTLQFTANVRTASGGAVPDAQVSWTSSNPAVVSLTAGGLATAQQLGRASVSARSGSLSASATVDVIPRPPAVVQWVTKPQSTWLGSVFTIQPVVEVRDAVGNLVQVEGLSAVATLVGDTAGLILGGDLSVPVQGGIARFTNLSVSSLKPREGSVTMVVSSGSLPPTTPAVLTLTQVLPTGGFTFSLSGPEETVLDVDQYGMRHTPDGQISFRRTSGEVTMWFPCSVSTCLLRGRTFDQLGPLVVNGASKPIVFGPSATPAAFDSNYAGGTSVLPTASGRDLLMVYHAERHPCNSYLPFHMSVGIARSSDGGVTWQREGQIGRSAQTVPAGCDYDVAGLGNPSVVPSRDGQYLFMYFNERVANRPDEIYLARASIGADGMAGTWMRFIDGGFTSPLLGGPAGTPVIRRPEPVDTTHFVAQAEVSWNLFLSRYVAVFGTKNGFYLATSLDGITWTDSRLILGVPSAGTEFPVYPVYPSLLSLDQHSQQLTGQSGFLYYARFSVGGNPPHNMVRRPFIILPAK
jgi:hypothetical protein